MTDSGSDDAPAAGGTKERRLRLTVAYEGAPFHGFQRQRNASPTVQEVLEAAVETLTGRAHAVEGAGRTDAGVHAVAQVVALTTCCSIPTERFPYAVNGETPRSLVVRDAREASGDFHPQFDAAAKEYIYVIHEGRLPLPFLRRWSHLERRRLDLEAMSEAAAQLEGTHDFASFCSSGSGAKTTVRRLRDLTLKRRGPVVLLRAVGDGFLYHMVRIIAGTLLTVGRGKEPPAWAADVLAARDRRQAGFTAPPEGLFLHRVFYDTEAAEVVGPPQLPWLTAGEPQQS